MKYIQFIAIALSFSFLTSSHVLAIAGNEAGFPQETFIITTDEPTEETQTCDNPTEIFSNCWAGNKTVIAAYRYALEKREAYEAKDKILKAAKNLLEVIKKAKVGPAPLVYQTQAQKDKAITDAQIDVNKASAAAQTALDESNKAYNSLLQIMWLTACPAVKEKYGNNDGWFKEQFKPNCLKSYSGYLGL